ncbi:hypothetical protein BH20ACI1_BH20ACI1_11360 [soil metagenome]
MNRTKLKDKIYGEMFWEEWDEFQSFWYAPMTIEADGKFDLLIHADSPLDFLAVGGTHKTFYKLLEDMPSIRKKTVRDLVENGEITFPKSKHKKTAMEMLEKELKLISIKIFGDLSAEIIFDAEMFDETDDVIFTLIDKDGEFIEAEISKF